MMLWPNQQRFEFFSPFFFSLSSNKKKKNFTRMHEQSHHHIFFFLFCLYHTVDFGKWYLLAKYTAMILLTRIYVIIHGRLEKKKKALSSALKAKHKVKSIMPILYPMLWYKVHNDQRLWINGRKRERKRVHYFHKDSL